MATTSTISTPTYQTHVKHRNNTPNASQWSVAVIDEQNCFELSQLQNWTNNSVAWGLHFGQTYAVNTSPVVLGFDVVAGLQEYVKIAKFVNNQGIYHGYPVAHWSNPYDRPPERVLQRWHNQGHITKVTLSRITRRKKCDVK